MSTIANNETIANPLPIVPATAAESETNLESRDRELFDTIAEKYAAKVPMNPPWLTAPASRVACGLDRGIEAIAGRLLALTPVTWNVIAAGQKPCDARSTPQNSQALSA